MHDKNLRKHLINKNDKLKLIITISFLLLLILLCQIVISQKVENVNKVDALSEYGLHIIFDINLSDGEYNGDNDSWNIFSDVVKYSPNGAPTPTNTEKVNWKLIDPYSYGGNELKDILKASNIFALAIDGGSTFPGQEVTITTASSLVEVSLTGLLDAIKENVIIDNKILKSIDVVAPEGTTLQVSFESGNEKLYNENNEKLEFLYTANMYGVYYGYVIQAQWEEVPKDYNITLSNDGEGGTSSLEIVNSVPTVTTITPPTKEGYRFLGYYKENNTTSQQYIDSAGNVNQDSSLYTTTITTLYAQWEIVPEITLTLNCLNDSNQNYFVYIYEGNVLKSQMYVQGQATIKLAYSEQQYKIQFVLSYLGTVSYSVNGGGLQNNKTLVLSDFKDTTISYQVFTSNINNNVII